LPRDCRGSATVQNAVKSSFSGALEKGDLRVARTAGAAYRPLPRALGVAERLKAPVLKFDPGRLGAYHHVSKPLGLPRFLGPANVLRLVSYRPVLPSSVAISVAESSRLGAPAAPGECCPN
jgi:hypothetical protein